MNVFRNSWSAERSLCVAVQVAFAGALVACGGSSSDPALCGDERTVDTIYNGTLQPSYLPLTPGQIQAIGELPGCSGTLIAGTWVLTAEHCQLAEGAQFCVGPDPANANVCARAIRVIDHPTADMTLLELEQDMRALAPEVIPIAIMTETMDETWIDQTAEASGYGVTETGSSGTRYFVAERIVGVTEYVTVDGEGRHGVCFGDSGGPTMVIASDGTIRVAGALSFGDNSCVDVDNFTRVDTEVEWIESFTGPTVVEQPGCGGIDAVGRCVNGAALFCDADELVSNACPDGTACGWDEATDGFRCIAGPDPCEGFDTFGACVGDVATWCEDGVVLRRDCGSCGGEQCQPVGGVGVYCAVDPCDGLDFLGRCNGDIAEWCEGGVFLSRDCGAMGQVCRFIDDDIGFYCDG